MSLRINHNISALNSHRNLQANNMQLGKSLERLSSGLKINRASDGPASLVISEQMRAQIAGLDQAVRNSETAVSMVQTTEAALNEVANLLVNVRQLTVHASNEGANDEVMLNADQQEIVNSLENIDRIAKNTSFGTVKLLDGSNSANGVATGEGLDFIEATTETRGSGKDGFNVQVTENASKARIQGTEALTLDTVKSGETFKILEGGKVATYTTKSSDTVETAMQNLQASIDKAGLAIDVHIDDYDGTMVMEHRNFGSEFDFKASSSSQGLLSTDAGEFVNSMKGSDIVATINGESTTGRGQEVEGVKGAQSIEGLKLRYTEQADLRDRNLNGDLITADKEIIAKNDQNQAVLIDQDGNEKIAGTFNSSGVIRLGKTENGTPIEYKASELKTSDEVSGNISSLKDQGLLEKDELRSVTVGNVHVSQNSVNFQVGGNRGQTVGISLLNTASSNLGKGIENESGYKALSDIDVRTFTGAQDAMSLIDKAINEVSTQRSTLGAFQKNNLESNLVNLRVAHESLTSAESVLRDADMAAEMATFTRNQIMTQSATAMLAQANNVPSNVLTLIG